MPNTNVGNSNFIYFIMENERGVRTKEDVK